MEKSLSDKNYLLKSHLPSIGCFCTVLQYVSSKCILKGMLAMLFKGGKRFYQQHVKISTEFSDILIIDKNSPKIIEISCNTLIRECLKRIQYSSKRVGFYKIIGCEELQAFINFLVENPLHKAQITTLKILSQQVNDEISYLETRNIHLSELLSRILPTTIKHLTLKFALSFKLKIVKVHENICNYLQNTPNIQSLKLERIIIFVPEIDNIWGNFFKLNQSLKKLTIKDSSNNYDFGEQFWMGLKRKPAKITHFRLINTKLTTYSFYYFTAFLRSTPYFTQFEMRGSCFQKITDLSDKKVINNQTADFNLIDELMGRRIHDLKFCISKDSHMYEGNEQNAFANVMKGFLGENITIQNASINDNRKISYLVDNHRVKKFKLESSYIIKSQFDKLIKSLGIQPNLISFKLNQVLLNNKNKDSLIPLENCKNLQILSIQDTGEGSFQLIENLVSRIGKQLRSFAYVSTKSDSQQRFSLLIHLNPKILRKLKIQCALYQKYPDMGIEFHDNLEDIHALSTFNNLQKLKLHLDYISLNSINALGDMLSAISQNLRYLQIEIYKECMDLQLMTMTTFTSISSDDYEKYQKRNQNKEGVKQYMVNFAEGLGLCTRLIEVKLPTEFLDTPFFDNYYGFIDRNGLDSNLFVMRSVLGSQQTKPEIYKSFLL
ncbi:UNKNOWN [Stylonychia lemnae]|uniref:Uncharacterized protein n=1 Tax=Stylonychia lemnae TaxID=5949 RepID=A0A078AFD7_STYLE|nr:UNKNOWN [Stylonychia lemnae]|eukprot:CDW80880.1 UNKNOWN [Stylonychia lemnae]